MVWLHRIIEVFLHWLSSQNVTSFVRVREINKNEKIKEKNKSRTSKDIAKGTVTWMRIPRPFSLVKFRDLVIHINRGLVVNLGNTCAESKEGKAAREVWHVQQLCGFRRCRVLWSAVLRCDKALAEPEPVAGRCLGWTGPYGLSRSVRKGTCSAPKQEQAQKVLNIPLSKKKLLPRKLYYSAWSGLVGYENLFFLCEWSILSALMDGIN